MATPPLKAFIKSNHNIMAFDPGETTGFCVFNGAELDEAKQLITKTVDDKTFNVLKDEFEVNTHKHALHPVDEVVIEDYRVYGWKTEEHSFAGLHTPKLIGMIITLCIIYKLPYTLRMAQPAKAFVTDQKLEDWKLYNEGQRHSRDAMRHAIFQLCFPTKDVSV